jgi:hypothetical protein
LGLFDAEPGSSYLDKGAGLNNLTGNGLLLRLPASR